MNIKAKYEKGKFLVTGELRWLFVEKLDYVIELYEKLFL